ncbi:hypothetical protein IJO12_01930, partial [bacterium]|nr:hypothetical protein [bacterium]
IDTIVPSITAFVGAKLKSTSDDLRRNDVFATPIINTSVQTITYLKDNKFFKNNIIKDIANKNDISSKLLLKTL